MRLIDVRDLDNLAFREFYDAQIPRYAILSHRWGAPDDEVTYKEFRKGQGLDKPGYEKILRFCELARSDGYEYAWVDTCCIDKRSSAELTEAINSMFNWYHNAQSCYVYLSDCTKASDWRLSSWWSRGWTLQELIAPRCLVFYDCRWSRIGTKTGMALAIEELTGIPSRALVGSERKLYMHWTVAQKMSWAAGRDTSRVEDRAYSLMGLFHVNMPLLYGEGNKAFERLQLVILEKYADESIFAWLPDSGESHMPELLLASDPSQFKDCTRMQPSESSTQVRWSSEDAPRLLHPPRRTSWGIELEANAYLLYPRSGMVDEIGAGEKFLWAMVLICAWENSVVELPCTIVLVRRGPAVYGYKRLECHHMPREQAVSLLEQRYTIGNEQPDRTFYLQYDMDFDHDLWAVMSESPSR